MNLLVAVALASTFLTNAPEAGYPLPFRSMQDAANQASDGGVGSCDGENPIFDLVLDRELGDDYRILFNPMNNKFVVVVYVGDDPVLVGTGYTEEDEASTITSTVWYKIEEAKAKFPSPCVYLLEEQA